MIVLLCNWSFTLSNVYSQSVLEYLSKEGYYKFNYSFLFGKRAFKDNL